MLTTLAAGRVFDFSHAVGRGGGSGMGFSRAVALALGEGDTRLVKKLKCTIFAECTGQPSPTPCLAISRTMARTYH